MRFKILLLSLFYFSALFAGEIPSSFNKVYGGEEFDLISSIVQANDSGYIAVGYTESRGNGKKDALILKLNENGDTLWSKTYGGPNNDLVYSVVQTFEGYIIAGRTKSFSINNYSYDGWCIKINNEGKLLWQKNLGGGTDDCISEVIPLSKEEFLLIGSKGNHAWITKINSSGTIIYDNTYGTNYKQHFFDAEVLRDGIILVGETYQNIESTEDILLVKVDDNGKTLWIKTHGEKGDDHCTSIARTKNNQFLLNCNTDSFNSNSTATWILSLNEEGDTLWTQLYNTDRKTYSLNIINCSNNKYILTNYHKSGVQLLRMSKKGKLLWSKSYGGEGDETIYQTIETKDGGFISVGFTTSEDISKNSSGNFVAWIFKVDKDGNF